MPSERKLESSVGKRNNFSTDTDKGRDKEPDSRTQAWIYKDGDCESHIQKYVEVTDRFSECTDVESHNKKLENEHSWEPAAETQTQRHKQKQKHPDHWYCPLCLTTYLLNPKA